MISMDIIMDRVTCVTCFLQIFIFSTYAISGDLDSSAVNRTSKLYNPIVQLVNFPNFPCTGTATRWLWSCLLFDYFHPNFSLTGICYSSEECSNVGGGQADGKCAQGFGVCCVIRSVQGHCVNFSCCVWCMMIYYWENQRIIVIDHCTVTVTGLAPIVWYQIACS